MVLIPEECLVCEELILGYSVSQVSLIGYVAVQAQSKSFKIS